ncbi:MAG: SufD family Fe-S cluster assembly protein, partial [Patescibacteria group bacterium]|nr:SufD family Fe-S cluster assembly protein [Patescibacteria group bacterium]
GVDTIAHFTNHNLLLNKNAHTTISPQLEVMPSDVECTHATTTAPLNKKQLQYLSARGMTNTQAKQLLIDGFINEISRIK